MVWESRFGRVCCFQLCNNSSKLLSMFLLVWIVRELKKGLAAWKLALNSVYRHIVIMK